MGPSDRYVIGMSAVYSAELEINHYYYYEGGHHWGYGIMEDNMEDILVKNIVDIMVGTLMDNMIENIFSGGICRL